MIFFISLLTFTLNTSHASTPCEVKLAPKTGKIAQKALLNRGYQFVESSQNYAMEYCDPVVEPGIVGCKVMVFENGQSKPVNEAGFEINIDSSWKLIQATLGSRLGNPRLKNKFYKNLKFCDQ